MDTRKPDRVYSSCLTARIDIKQVIADLKEIHNGEYLTKEIDHVLTSETEIVFILRPKRKGD